MKTVFPEILCPVGNKEMLTAAVRSGADAVYLGAEHFNARRNAENFTNDDLADAIKYCHIRGVKVYLTLNIILSNSELNDALQLAHTAYINGIDAVIVADLGLIRLLNRHLPELPLHASTQMTVHTPSAIPFLKRLGIKRVVLARELNRNTIEEICTAAHNENIEIEHFVHGALCMSVSGQCLLSSMLGGRSGNRGLCAGPCRLPFAAPNGNGYDLSLKDLSLINHIKELVKLGVDSFKIEGRMKRPEYVAVAAAALRSAIYEPNNLTKYDNLLCSVFSRSGFTDGYFTEKKSADMFGIRTRDDVTAANKVLNEIHSIYRNERQSIELCGKIVIKAAQSTTLTLSDGINSATSSAPPPDTAINRSIDAQTVKKSISKLGGTPFLLKQLDCEIDDGLSLSAASLNELRRDCIEKLTDKRAQEIKTAENIYYQPKTDISQNKKPYIFCRLDNPEQLTEDITAFSLPLHHGITEKIKSSTAQKWVELPRWVTSDQNLAEQLEYFKNNGFTGAIYSNVAQILPIQKSGLKIMANFCINVYNTEAAQLLAEFGTDKILLSPEILLDEAKKLPAAAKKGIIAYGNIPLMLTVNCPIKNGMSCKDCKREQSLTDRKGIHFPVRCQQGYSELLNSRPIYLADRMDEIDGLDFITFYFTDETDVQVKTVINAYKNKEKPTGEYTRGMYYRLTQ